MYNAQSDHSSIGTIANDKPGAMKKTIVLILFVAFIEASIGLSASQASFSVSSIRMKTPVDAPELNGLRLLFRGQQVDEVVSAKKIKKYSIELTGTGFLPASTVVVNSIRAFPVTFGEPAR